MDSEQSAVQTTFHKNVTDNTPARTKAKVSILVVNYNNANDILRCIASLLEQDYEDYEIIIVDNASTDDSVSRIEQQFPQVTLVQSDNNLGFGGGNNLAAKHATGTYLALLNPDTTVEPDCLQQLVSALEAHPRAGIATAKILMMGEPHPINTTGNFMHFTGFGYLRGWQEPATAYNEPGEIFSMSGAGFMISRDLYMQIGGFDELMYPAYVEDIDLSWRVWLAGYTCRYVPDAVVYHDYTLTFNINKYTMLERHRQQMVIKNFHWATILILLPAFILAEIVTWGYAVLNGVDHMRAKLRSYNWIFTRWSALMEAKRLTQQQRKITDREILKMCVYRLAYGQAGSGLAVKVGEWVIDPIFFILHRIALFIVRW